MWQNKDLAESKAFSDISVDCQYEDILVTWKSLSLRFPQFKIGVLMKWQNETCYVHTSIIEQYWDVMSDPFEYGDYSILKLMFI